MKTKTIFSKPVNRGITIAIGFIFLLAMVGCGGGGGGEQVSTAQNVTISGKVDDGTTNSPIPNAECRFVDTGQNEHASVLSASNGEFSLIVPMGLEGYVRCSPQDLAYLTIYTFSSTKGMAAGGTISGEKVTPATTIVADIIRTENPADPKARKQELIASIEMLQDTELAMIAELSTMLYKAMYEQRVNVNFGGGGGGDGGGDGGGVGGDAGDGGDFSPISNARCEFIVGNNLKERQVLYSAALADFLSYGKVNRPDLKKIAELVNSALGNHTPEEIKAAFSKYFKEGIGQPYFAIADEKGSYFLSIPSNVPGLVRCIPPNQEKLVLGTYVREREAGEKLLGQDVSPATTIFSNNIVSKLDEDLSTTKENFLDDIVGLGVHIVLENGTVNQFQLIGMPKDKGVGMVAFSATSLFNIFYKNGIDGDYLSALDDLVSTKVVDPGFLQTQGLSVTQANVVVGSVDTAEGTLVSLGTALSTARINVMVTDTPGGQLINGAKVTITQKPNDVTYSPIEGGNPAIFTLTGVPTEGDIKIIVEANVPGFDPVTKSVSIVAFSTVDLEIALSATFPLQVQIGGNGYGFVTSSPVAIDCGSHENESNGTECTAAFNSGTQVTLSASPIGGSKFTGWSGGGCIGSGLCIVTLNQALSVTATFTQQSDISAPTVSITSPTSNSTYTAYSSPLNIGGTASDDVGVTLVTWSNSRGGSGTCTGTTSWSANNISLSGGVNVITITARDAAGKTGTDTITVTAEISIPTVSITSPTSNTTYTTYSSSLNISGTAWDDVGVTLVRWSNSRGGYGNCSGTTSWSASNISLYEGTNIITVDAEDASDKAGSDTLTVTYVINIAPIISNVAWGLMSLNDPKCSLSLPYGSLYHIQFDYTDSNGNGPINISQAKVEIAYDFPYGVDGGFTDYTWYSGIQGNGTSGTVVTQQCYRFGSNPSVTVTMTIEDLLGAKSNPLAVTIPKPSGSN